jgi:4-hydroxy 2-oxovalerate aldolase
MTTVFLQDVTLRDGMHALRHRVSLDDVAHIVRALDAAGSTPWRSPTVTAWAVGH